MVTREELKELLTKAYEDGYSDGQFDGYHSTVLRDGGDESAYHYRGKYAYEVLKELENKEGD